MPLGFLWPRIWDLYRSFKRIILRERGLSILVEFGQLFNRRKTNIDDLLTNTLGAAIGYGASLTSGKISKHRFEVTGSVIKNEAFSYMGLAVLGRFSLYNWKFFVKIFLAIYGGKPYLCA